jgi:hypothetical protein
MEPVATPPSVLPTTFSMTAQANVAPIATCYCGEKFLSSGKMSEIANERPVSDDCDV